LYNIIGQSVFEGKVLTNSAIALPQLSNGIYMLQINHAQNFRVIIAR
jgi:hypothetical protein